MMCEPALMQSELRIWRQVKRFMILQFMGSELQVCPDRQNDGREFLDDFRLQFLVPRHSDVPFGVLVVYGRELDAGYLHGTCSPGHERHANSRAYQVENGEGVVSFVDDPWRESRAVTQADAVIVIGSGNAAVNENESLLLNTFHCDWAAELGRRRNGEALGQNLPDRELRMIHRQAHEADVDAP